MVGMEMSSVGATSANWKKWADDHPMGGLLVVGLVATQMATFLGYAFAGIGLPQVGWPLFNGALGAPAAEFGGTGSFFVGQSLHMANGIVFTILYAAMVYHMLPFAKNHMGNVLRGLSYGGILTVISVGFLLPYVYLPKQGFGLFSFDGPDGWKLPAAVLLWHSIYGFFLGALYQPGASRSSE